MVGETYCLGFGKNVGKKRYQAQNSWTGVLVLIQFTVPKQQLEREELRAAQAFPQALGKEITQQTNKNLNSWMFPQSKMVEAYYE